MGKKRLYIIFIILIVIAFFSTAVTCNLCGTPIEIITPGEDTTGEDQETGQEAYVPSSSSSSSQSQSTSENTEAAEPDNNPPEIIEIELFGVDIELYEREGIFDAVTVSNADSPEEVYMSIISDDDDDDELEYRAYDSRDDEYEVTKINNNSAEFYWYIPSESGPYTLTIEVTDGRGGIAQRDIEMTLVLEVFEFIPPEEEAEEAGADDGEVAMGEGVRGFAAEPTLTGQVNETGDVFLASESSGAPNFYAGDTTDNNAVRGFISFDISEIAGEEVIAAWLNIEGSAIGNPGANHGNIFVSHVDFGSSLDTADFSLEGEHLYGRRPGYRDLSFSNEQLANAVRIVLSEERQYFQVMVGYYSLSNNDNSDGLNFLLSDINLEVAYR